MTSTRAGSIIKKILDVKKIGHFGTLDPLATGVLVLAIGEATKLIPYLEEVNPAEKTYEFDVYFGKATDTFDADGKVIECCEIIPSKEDIINICKEMIGEQEQVPPVYSAIKFKGKRLCDLARKNIFIDCQKRKINVHTLEFISLKDNIASFCVKCSRGTYVRSLAVDIAKKLFTVGHVTKLRRIKDGNFDIKDAISLEFLRNLSHKYIYEVFVPIGAVLDDIPAVPVNEQNFFGLKNGESFFVTDTCLAQSCDKKSVRILFEETLVAVGRVENGVCYPKRVLNFCKKENSDVDN